jgi:hypothetical protein
MVEERKEEKKNVKIVKYMHTANELAKANHSDVVYVQHVSRAAEFYFTYLTS